MSVRDEIDTVEAVVGDDPRAEALSLIDGAWIDTMNGSAGEPGEALRRAGMQIDAAKVAAALYVGDQIKALREDLRVERERSRP